MAERSDDDDICKYENEVSFNLAWGMMYILCEIGSIH